MTTILDVRGLRVRFSTNAGIVHAVNGVTFQVDEGEAVGIVGESGSGKSVTALSIMGLVPQPPAQVEAESIAFDGRDLLALSPKEMDQIRGRRIGMVFQDPMSSMNPVLTIGRQLQEPLEQHLGLNRSEARERAIELLQMVGIPGPRERIDAYPHQFSGGMRQRVMIAMALAGEIDLLIADEPTTALDVTVQAEIVDLVQDLQSRLGLSVIWITHDLGLLARFAQRILVMYAGHVVESALTRELYANPRHPYTMGLLRSVPNLESDRTARLATIPGSPPTLIDLPTGCPFRTRCSFAIEKCVEDPPLLSVGPAHMSACWVQPKGIEFQEGETAAGVATEQGVDR